MRLTSSELGKQFITIGGKSVTMVDSPSSIPKKKGLFLFDDNMWRDELGWANAPDEFNLQTQ